MRTFIAVEVPFTVKNLITELENRLKGTRADIKWVQPRNIHITLKFLGDIDNVQSTIIREGLCKALKSTNHFSLSLGRLGAFPDLSQPRFFWISVNGGRDELIAMQQRIENELHSRCFIREERPFTPHVTIGRVRSLKDLTNLKERIGTIMFETAPFRVTRVAIVRSHLRPTGPDYQVIDYVEMG